jgi:hypothetical protein
MKLDMTTVTNALNRAMHAHPGDGISLSADASQMATVYALMTFEHLNEWPESKLTDKQRAAFEKYVYSSEGNV